MALIDDIREAIGPDAASILVQAYGGNKVYVPITAYEAHRISKLIGAEPAAALSRRFGGEVLQLPSRGVRREQIMALSQAGMKPPDIAHKLGCSRQWVLRVLNEPA